MACVQGFNGLNREAQQRIVGLVVHGVGVDEVREQRVSQCWIRIAEVVFLRALEQVLDLRATAEHGRRHDGCGVSRRQARFEIELRQRLGFVPQSDQPVDETDAGGQRQHERNRQEQHV